MDLPLTVECADDLTITILNSSTLTSDCSPRLYNSVSATEEEIASLRQMLGPNMLLTTPPRNIYSFSHYATLIQRSQNIAESDHYSISLSHYLAASILDLQTSYLITGNINPANLADVEDLLSTHLPKTMFKNKQQKMVHKTKRLLTQRFLTLSNSR
ncbi:hypothetical protein E4T42_05175 [Aureobasidium subglaciale]|nr:hypothetical protein E4T42_05175 [Aureobasidium subglaciale]